MAAAIAAAIAPAAVVLLGEDKVAFGGVIKIAGQWRQGFGGGLRHGENQSYGAQLGEASPAKDRIDE